MDFATGIFVGVAAGWFVGSRGTRAAGAWGDYKVAVARQKAAYTARFNGFRAAFLAWAVLFFVIAIAIGYAGLWPTGE